MAETKLAPPPQAGAGGAAAKARATKGVIVIKIGTSSLMREGTPAGDSTVSSAAGAALGAAGGSELALSTLALLVDTVLALRRDGWDVIIVSSGAVGVGCSRLGTTVRPVRGGASAAERAANLAAIQAYAAIGQSVLMRTYDDLFRMGGQPVAQVLLTSGDLSSQYQYGNAKATLHALLGMGVVPIVNENDTVATEELRYGDNDWLSALVACVVDATWLFLLTDVERLYTADPRRDAGAEAIDLVSDMAALSVDTSARAPPPPPSSPPAEAAAENGVASGPDGGDEPAGGYPEPIDVESRSPSPTGSSTTSAETIALATASAAASVETSRRPRPEGTTDARSPPAADAVGATPSPAPAPATAAPAADATPAPAATGSQWGTGGMATKLTAARMATAAGVRMALLHGRMPSRVLDFVAGNPDAVGTVFSPRRSPIKTTRKRWIAHCLPPTGVVVVDRGAASAVRGRKNLFAAGVVGVEGDFSANDAVVVRGVGGGEVARGLVNMAAIDVRRVMGMRSADIERLEGEPLADEVVSRDNLVVLV